MAEPTPQGSAVLTPDLIQRVNRNVGIVRMEALQRWADSAAVALDCTISLFGSALHTKEWRDLDIAMQWDRTPSGRAWLWLCHAFSVAATQEVGAPVEVHLLATPSPELVRLALAGPASKVHDLESRQQPKAPCEAGEQRG